MFQNGYHDIAPGRIAAVVTYLEMTSRAPERVIPVPDGLTFRRLDHPTPDAYRDLFLRVGGLPWLWFSRLVLSETELCDLIHNPDRPLYTLERDGRAEAMLELDFTRPDLCDLAYFGVTPALIGKGAGRYLMNRAIRLAWDRPITRFTLHTCTWDSPGALGFYIRSGFKPVRREIEIADDPRLIGLLPPEAGPHVPMIAP